MLNAFLPRRSSNRRAWLWLWCSILCAQAGLLTRKPHALRVVRTPIICKGLTKALHLWRDPARALARGAKGRCAVQCLQPRGCNPPAKLGDRSVGFVVGCGRADQGVTLHAPWTIGRRCVDRIAVPTHHNRARDKPLAATESGFVRLHQRDEKGRQTPAARWIQRVAGRTRCIEVRVDVNKLRHGWPRQLTC